MNERIEELEQQARDYGCEIGDLSYITFHKKFAELIVKECVMVVNSADDGGENYWGSCINDHFGVKE